MRFPKGNTPSEKGRNVGQRVVLVDDIEGGDAAESVQFALDGVSYEIDLNAKNAAKLRDVLAPYVGAARRVGGRAARGRGRAATTSAGRTADIRSWARAQGHKVSARGRVPADIVAAYEQAH